jgi:hypothetical protein
VSHHQIRKDNGLHELLQHGLHVEMVLSHFKSNTTATVKQVSLQLQKVWQRANCKGAVKKKNPSRSDHQDVLKLFRHQTHHVYYTVIFEHESDNTIMV